MKEAIVRLKDIHTGEIKDVIQQYDDDFTQERITLGWEHGTGNFACDCYRGIMFYPESEDEYPCIQEFNRFEMLELVVKHDV